MGGTNENCGECRRSRVTGARGLRPRSCDVPAESLLTERVYSPSSVFGVRGRGQQVRRALRFAAAAHKGQVRKVSGRPFIVHPAGVARIICCCGERTELIVAALLHDTVEDAGVSLATIETEFGVYVARLVECVTRDERGGSWKEGKEGMLAKLASAPEECLVLKCADALDNIRSIRRDVLKYGDSVWEIFRSKDEVFWYCRALYRLLSARLTRAPGRQLCLDLATEIGAVFKQQCESP